MHILLAHAHKLTTHTLAAQWRGVRINEDRGTRAVTKVNSHPQALKVEWEGVTRVCMSTLKITQGSDETGASHGVQT